MSFLASLFLANLSPSSQDAITEETYESSSKSPAEKLNVPNQPCPGHSLTYNESYPGSNSFLSLH